MKKVNKILLAWLTCLTMGVSMVGMTGCDFVEALKDGLNIIITTNKDGESDGETSGTNEQPPVKTPSVGLSLIMDSLGESSYNPETGEIVNYPSTYVLAGMGTCTDVDVVVPAEYNGGTVVDVTLLGRKTEEAVRKLGAEMGMSEEEIEETVSSMLAFGITEVAIQRIWLPASVESFAMFGFDSLTEIVMEASVKSINVIGNDNLKTVYYNGTEQDWLGTDLGETADQFKATVYFYSASAPTKSGYYWHYVDGEPTAW